MLSGVKVVVTGLGLEFPGVPRPEALLEITSPVEPTEFTPADKLGRQGLRYKDRATKLALCAAQSALKDAGLPSSAPEQISPETFATIVSSNLGNVDTVCRVLDTVRSEGADSTSPLDIPNLSSNVIASSVAIRFGLKAVNLMLCDGGTSGLDAVHLAANVIRAGRAERVLVVGVEPSNPVVEQLMKASATARHKTQTDLRLGDGAGALIVESEDSAAARGARVYASVGGYGYHVADDVEASVRAALDGGELPRLWLVPNCSYSSTAASVQRGLSLWAERAPACLDLSAALGETYGALGVLQCIAGCLWLKANPGAQAVATAGACLGDGSASLVIRDAGTS